MADEQRELYRSIGAIEQHLKGLNGSLPDMRESLANIDQRLTGLELEFASWKGRMTFASSFFGSLSAGFILAIKYMFFGGRD